MTGNAWLLSCYATDRRPRLYERPRATTSDLNKVTYVGDVVAPSPSEAGWKDTVIVTPGSSTRIIAKFEGHAGRYVWHCHILEHEDNEMMRPYEVVPG